MSADEGEDLSALAWPGFVDILSSVVMMFIFFVLITAFALLMHVIMYKSQFQQMTEQEQVTQKESIKKDIQKLSSEKQGLEDKIASLNDKIDMLNANLSESVNQEMNIDNEKNEIVIFFGEDAITVTQETKDAIKVFIDSLKERYPAEDLMFELVASRDPDAFTENVGRTIGFTRAFNARNVIVQNEILTDKIKVNVKSAEPIDGSNHWVTIKVLSNE